MLDDDENGNPMGMLCKGLDQQQQQQGTRWHEFKSGKNRYQLPFSHNSLFVSVNDNDKVRLQRVLCKTNPINIDMSLVLMVLTLCTVLAQL